METIASALMRANMFEKVSLYFIRFAKFSTKSQSNFQLVSVIHYLLRSARPLQ